MEISQNDTAVPLTILTGFLGAGKTTLLNRILNGSHGLRIAVLVNDFGAINIDSELIVGVEDGAISLANGCVCCQIRDDLVETVEEVIGRPEAPEYILLEASGVADPAGIAMTFVSPKFRDRIRLDSVTCVVDADQVFAYPDYPGVAELKMRQIGFSDMLILNKVDLLDEAGLAAVRDWIDGRLNRVRVVEASYCEVPLEILLAVGRFEPARVVGRGKATGKNDSVSAGTIPPGRLASGRLAQNPERSSHDHDGADHGRHFSTWSYQTDRPMSLEALSEMVKRKLPANIYRCKGIVYAVEADGRRAILQVVGRRTDLALEEDWGDRIPRSQIVAIGAPGSIDDNALTALFDSCIFEPAAAPHPP